MPIATPEAAAESARNVIAHYEKHACDWDADRRGSVWNDKPWHDRFLAALPAGAAVLDLGCGSGAPVAVNMAGRGIRVTGVDASPKLIGLCRDRLPRHEWIVADMRSFSLDRSFDGILAWDSFFHLSPDDQRRMFGVFAAHATPSASLMFNTGPAAGESLGRYRGDPLYHASLNPAEYEGLLAEVGFVVVEHVVEDWTTGGGRAVWLARMRN